jgi:hypothetical protein
LATPLLAVVAILMLASAEGAAPPAQLVCLARHYRIEPVLANGAWFGKLPDGTQLPFDDGRAKTFEQRLESPDLKDIFFVPYRPGPILPVEKEGHDPGRFRVEALLRATFGPRPAAEQVRARFLGMPVRVHRKVAPALARVEARLAKARERDQALRPFLRRLSGGFADRKIAGTDRSSAHAFGIAIDLDSSMSDYWRWHAREPHRFRNRIPQAIVDAFEAEGFIWGGRWYHYDTMHFEYRPELLDPGCSKAVSAGPHKAGR